MRSNQCPRYPYHMIANNMGFCSFSSPRLSRSRFNATTQRVALSTGCTSNWHLCKKGISSNHKVTGHPRMQGIRAIRLFVIIRDPFCRFYHEFHEWTNGTNFNRLFFGKPWVNLSDRIYLTWIWRCASRYVGVGRYFGVLGGIWYVKKRFVIPARTMISTLR